MTSAFLFLGLGKLTIYVIQKSPYFRNLNWRFLRDLLECDFCLGIWVYFILSLIFRVSWFVETIGYIHVVSELLTAFTASFLMWLLSEGWNSKFRELKIEV